MPWVYCEIEWKQVSGSQTADRARSLQGKLRNALISGGEESGVIGFRAGLNVQRLPAGVYWFGLRRWGLLRFDGSEDDYRRGLDGYYQRLLSAPTADAGESTDPSPANWDPHLPAPPVGWLSERTFDLSPIEADYLYQRIAQCAPRSLLAHLLLTHQAVADDDQFLWDPSYTIPLQPDLADQLNHARNFSEVMHGAALLYNLLLAEQKPGKQFVEEYRERLGAWYARLQSRSNQLAAWDRAAFWQLVQHDLGARVRGPARTFVDRWIEIALGASSPAGVIESDFARRSVAEQERAAKPGRARIGDPRATENWEGASGSAQLSYRWNCPVRAIVNDILDGLRVGTAAAAQGGGDA